MESAVDRTEVSQAAATHDDVAVHEASAVRDAVAGPPAPENPPDRAPDVKRTRQFDDIPSVVRALLTGYDEV
jgi:hypothetical protein